MVVYSRRRWCISFKTAVLFTQDNLNAGYSFLCCLINRVIFMLPNLCLKLLLLFLPSVAKVCSRYSFLLSFELLMMASINFMAVKLFIFRHINPKSCPSLQLQMVCKWLVINTHACIFKPWLCWQCLMLSSRIVLYISRVKISVQPATVEVVKYTPSLSINLYRRSWWLFNTVKTKLF